MRGDYDATLHEAIDEIQAMRRQRHEYRVQRIRTLAEGGESVSGIARSMGLAVSVVWTEMRRAGLSTARKDLDIPVPVPGL